MQLHDLVERVAHEGGPEVVWPVGPDAAIRLSDGEGHLLTGATIAYWPEDDE